MPNDKPFIPDTDTEMFRNGLEIRRAVLGREYVDGSLAPLWPFCSQAKPLLINRFPQEHVPVEGF